MFSQKFRLPLTQVCQRRVHFPVSNIWEGIVRRLAMPNDKQVHQVIPNLDMG
jgi:hypothetical protein